MTAKESSAAYRALKESGRRVLHVIEDVLSTSGDGVAISISVIMARTLLCRVAARHGVRQVVALGFVKVEVGPRQVRVFSMADGWRSIEAGEVKQRMATARQPVQRAVKPPQPVRVPKPPKVAPPRAVQRQTPSMPKLRCLEGGDSR